MENSKRCLKYSDVFRCLNVAYGIEDDITCVAYGIEDDITCVDEGIEDVIHVLMKVLKTI